MIWIQAHCLAIAAVATIVVATVINRLPVVPWWLSALADLLAVAAKPGHVGVVGAVNLPGLPSRPKGSPAVPVAAALLLLLTLPGCGYCLDQAHKLEPRCVAQDVATKCGTPAIEKLVGQILPQVVLALVNDSWSSLLDNIVATLQQQGVQDALQAVTCAVASTDINISGIFDGARAQFNPAVIQTVHEHAVAWRALHAMARR